MEIAAFNLVYTAELEFVAVAGEGNLIFFPNKDSEWLIN